MIRTISTTALPLALLISVNVAHASDANQNPASTDTKAAATLAAVIKETNSSDSTSATQATEADESSEVTPQKHPSRPPTPQLAPPPVLSQPVAPTIQNPAPSSPQPIQRPQSESALASSSTASLSSSSSSSSSSTASPYSSYSSGQQRPAPLTTTSPANSGSSMIQEQRDEIKPATQIAALSKDLAQVTGATQHNTLGNKKLSSNSLKDLLNAQKDLNAIANIHKDQIAELAQEEEKQVTASKSASATNDSKKSTGFWGSVTGFAGATKKAVVAGFASLGKGDNPDNNTKSTSL